MVDGHGAYADGPAVELMTGMETPRMFATLML